MAFPWAAKASASSDSCSSAACACLLSAAAVLWVPVKEARRLARPAHACLWGGQSSDTMRAMSDRTMLTRSTIRLMLHACMCAAEFVVVDTGGLMSDAAQLPLEERSAAQRLISDVGLPQARLFRWSAPAAALRLHVVTLISCTAETAFRVHLEGSAR